MLMDRFFWGWYGLEIPAGMSNGGGSGQEKSLDMFVGKFTAGI